jgi:hypothetical protein
MKFTLFLVSAAVLSACSSTNWIRPSDKSESDFYSDTNACRAESTRVTGSGYDNYWDNCMKAKGYRPEKKK